MQNVGHAIDRRSFIGSLFAIALSPLIAKAIPQEETFELASVDSPIVGRHFNMIYLDDPVPELKWCYTPEMLDDWILGDIGRRELTDCGVVKERETLGYSRQTNGPHTLPRYARG